MLGNNGKLYAILLFLLFISRLAVRATGFVPVVTNFASTDYDGGLQNWDISQDGKGAVYIANNNGVLVYDGYTWQNFPLPGDAVVRSVMCDGQRIYVGSTLEFGYMTADATGSLTYHSLWKLARDYKPHNDEIWRIVKTGDGKILFQSFCSWFEYDGRTVTAHYNPKEAPLFFYKARSEIYVQLMHGNFCRLEHGRYKPVVDRRSVGDDDVMGVVPWRDGGLLLCTDHNGIFAWRGGSVTPWHTSADGLLRSGRVNRVVPFRHGGGLVVGTVTDGVAAFDNSGNMLWHYNTANLINNNTVLGLHCDNDDNVWVACDIGIALVHSGSPYSILGDSHHPMGMVYDMMRTAAGTYLATNQATYLYRDGTLARVAGTDGQNWHLSLLGENLIVGNNKGILRIDGLSASWLPESGYASSTALHRLSTNDKGTGEYIIVSTYASLGVYQDLGGKIKFRNIVRGFSAPVRQFQVDNHGNLWATNMVKGMYRVRLSADLRRAESVSYFPAIDSSRVARPISVTKLYGSIVFSDGSHVRRLAEDGRLVTFGALERLTKGDIISATRVDNERAWIATRRGYMLISNKNGRLKSLLAIPASFFNSECSDNSNRVYVDGDYAYLCMNDVVGRVDMRRVSGDRWRVSGDGWQVSGGRCWVRHAESCKPDGTLMPIAVDGSDPATAGSVTITLGFANFSREQLSFAYSLTGDGREIRGVRATPVLSFSNLGYGSYRLHVDVTDVNGRVVDSVEYKFHHPRPTWLSLPAFMLYICALVLVGYGIAKWYTRRAMAKKQAQMEEERMRQELRIAEQNRIIEEQKKLLLEEQLKDKGKEIASLTMSGLRQKQQMREISQELSNGSRKLSKQNIQAMLNHITGGVDDDAYWDMYNENFDLIHKNFFRNLRKLNPSLTATDMKFCALLRLNLSTKEIAKFTGLTQRGVEGARYRLRKKLGIPKEQSITQFLLDID